jgi:hypothetical protein
MKTLADIKRRMVPGTRLEVTGQTKRPELVGSVRTVVDRNGTSWRFTTDRTGDDEHFQAWPKAAKVRILDADTYEYDYAADCTVALRFLAGEVA